MSSTHMYVDGLLHTFVTVLYGESSISDFEEVGRSTTKSTLCCYQNEPKLPLAVYYVTVGTQDWCLCDP